MAKICPKCETKIDDMSVARCPIDGNLLVILPEQQFRVGSRIDGRFEILRQLGQGAMGTVYLARHVAINRLVAVKVLRSHHAENVEAIRRFLREARAVAALSHPHIVTMHDFGQTPEGLLYIVMEYVEGRSLAQALRDDGPLPASRVVHIGVQICDALTEAHGKGIIHRDLKPENILIQDKPDAADSIKVVDFGIAKVSGEGSIAASTATGRIIGTPRYMSPEMAKGLPISPRSDLYSLGVILYELIAGVPPFVSESPITLMIRHAEEAPQLLKERPNCNDLAPALDAVILSVLAKRPETRPPTAAALKADLLEALASSDLVRLPSSAPLPNVAGEPASQRIAVRFNNDAVAPEQSALTVIRAPSTPETSDPPVVTQTPVLGPSTRPTFKRTAYVLVAAVVLLVAGLVLWLVFSPKAESVRAVVPSSTQDRATTVDVAPPPRLAMSPNAEGRPQDASDTRPPADAVSDGGYAKDMPRHDERHGDTNGGTDVAPPETKGATPIPDSHREGALPLPRVWVTMISVPSKANVLRNGREICETPCSVSFRPPQSFDQVPNASGRPWLPIHLKLRKTGYKDSEVDERIDAVRCRKKGNCEIKRQLIW